MRTVYYLIDQYEKRTGKNVTLYASPFLNNVKNMECLKKDIEAFLNMGRCF
jgi:hypothetical protein